MNNLRCICAPLFTSTFILQLLSPCESEAHARKYTAEDSIWLDFEQPSAIIRDGTENNSYFGAAVALHRSAGGEGWLFIGAPKANDAASARGILKPGKVWRINLDRRTSSALSGITNTLCSPQSAGGWSRTHAAQCNGMFLGGTLVTSGDKLVACAHRWGRIKNYGYDFQGTEGACYWHELSELTETTLPPRYSGQQLLIPIADKDFVNRNNRLDSNRFTRWEQGQFGFSAHVSKFRQQLIAGAVGVFRFDGGVILPPPILQPSDSPRWTLFSVELLSYQVYSKIESLCEPKRDTNVWIRALNSGYLGYSVTSGRYFSAQEMVVAGAPRSAGGKPCGQLLGSALIMSYSSAAPSERVKPRSADNFRWRPYVAVGGDGLGSYFGAAMESVDINNDDLDDLIVGAPLECGGNEDQDCAGFEDTGCVYVYSQMWEPATLFGGGSVWKHAQRICGDVPWGRFGSAVARLGDIDQDGFNDFAVGAPSDNDFGAVYIFFGQKNNRELQRMRIMGGARRGAVGSVIQTGFGQSIIGDVDLDGNGTPDFAVGSYLTQTVAIFRTPPRLNVTVSSMEFYRNRSSERTTTLVPADTEFRIRYCVEISLLPPGARRLRSLTIRNRLTMDEKWNRFQLRTADLFELNFPPTVRRSCIELDANRTQAVADAEDFPEVTFSAHAWYNAPNASELTSPSESAQDRNSQLLMEGSPAFCTECPYSMNRTFSRLPTLAFAIDCMKRGDRLALPVCKPVFAIAMHHATVPNSATNDLLVLGRVSSLLVAVTVRNQNQTAFRPTLKFSWRLKIPTDGGSNWRQTMTLPRIMETAQVQPCSNGVSNQSAYHVCQLLRKVLRKDNEVTLTYALRMGDVVALRRSRTPTQLEFNTEVFLENDAQFKPANQSYMVNVVTPDAKVTVSSTAISERLPLVSNMAVKKSVDAKFQVKLGGQSPVRVKLIVGLAVALTSAKSGKLFDIRRPDGDCAVRSECWVCQRLNGSMKNWPGKPVLGPLNSNVSAKISANCLSAMDPSCEHFHCEKDVTRDRNILANFHLHVSAESEIRIGAHVTNCSKWNLRGCAKTGIFRFTGNLVGSEGLGFVGFAYAYIFDDREGTVATDHSACLFELNLLPSEQNGIQAWIVILAAASALLILSCVIFGLCKCGFFKREKREQLLAEQQTAGGAESDECASSGGGGGAGISDETAEVML